MSSRYERIPNPHSTHREDEDELEAAFDDSDDNDSDDNDQLSASSIHIQEQRPLVQRDSTSHYDFERVDYDYPPPGSPPHPTASALPDNAAYGNTNGLVPSSPVERPTRRTPAYRSWLSRIIPFYHRLAPTQRPQGRVGGGAENDGVFANLMSKPTRARRVEDEDGVHFVPEETQSEAPPVLYLLNPKFTFNIIISLMQWPKLMQFPPTGKLQFMHQPAVMLRESL